MEVAAGVCIAQVQHVHCAWRPARGFESREDLHAFGFTAKLHARLRAAL